MEVGPVLRRRRQALGYTLEDAQAATKIRLRYLQALEDERFEDLPAPVYTRGFIRSYASFLELDGASLAAEWGKAATEAGVAEAASESAADSPAPAQPAPTSQPLTEPAASRPRSRARPPQPGDRSGNGGTAAPVRTPRPRRPPSAQRAGTTADMGVADATGGPAPAPSAARAAGQPRSPRGPRPTSRLGRRGRSATALWIVALVAIVAAAYAWQAQARSPVPTARSTTTPAASATHSAAATVATATYKPASVQSSPSVTTSTGVDSTGSPLTTYRIAGASTLTVVATASARCWVRVWLDGSATYTDHLLTPGESATWQAQRQVRLRIGYPSGLQLTADGVALPQLRTNSPVDAAVVLAAP